MRACVSESLYFSCPPSCDLPLLKTIFSLLFFNNNNNGKDQVQFSAFLFFPQEDSFSPLFASLIMLSGSTGNGALVMFYPMNTNFVESVLVCILLKTV